MRRSQDGLMSRTSQTTPKGPDTKRLWTCVSTIHPVPQDALPVKAGRNAHHPRRESPDATAVKPWYGVHVARSHDHTGANTVRRTRADELSADSPHSI